MKKLILLFLLLPFIVMAQISTGQEQEFETGIKNNSTQTVTNAQYLVTQGSDGTYGKILPSNLTQTTAGTFARVNFTGDISVVNSVNYYATSTTSKGSVASVAQTVSPDDNQKLYFAQDYISILQTSLVIYPQGNYSGQFAVQVANNSVQQKFYIEVYKTNNLGVPIASGVSGAPIGSLGVTLITTLESGLVALTGSVLTNITLTGNLTGQLTVNANERIRYHIAAEKVGTAGGTISMQIFSGTNYNSYYDVPVPVTTNDVINKVPGLGNTVTDALTNLKGAIPTNYAKIVYVNNVNPNSATIFALENPPLINDNSLKANTNYLYVGSDSSGWVYNSSTLTYTVKPATASNVSNFYIASTAIDATGDKTGPIERPGTTFYNDLRIKTQPVGSSSYALSQTIGTTGYDFWQIYGEASNADQGIMVFKVGDNGSPFSPVGQKFDFRYDASDSGIAKTPFSIDYDLITATTKIQAINYSFTMGSSGAAGIVSSSSSFGAIAGSVAYGISTNEGVGGLDIMANQAGVPIRFWSGTNNTAPTKRMELGTSGVNIPSLSGIGSANIQTDASGNLSRGNIVPKIYSALMSQVGTSAPTVTVLENTLGGSVVWTRSSTGIYIGTLTGAFPNQKVTILSGSNVIDTLALVNRQTNDTVSISTYTSSTGTAKDGALANTTIEIKVYP